MFNVYVLCEQEKNGTNHDGLPPFVGVAGRWIFGSFIVKLSMNKFIEIKAIGFYRQA